jgi:hypothetical protein
MATKCCDGKIIVVEWALVRVLEDYHGDGDYVDAIVDRGISVTKIIWGKD